MPPLDSHNLPRAVLILAVQQRVQSTKGDIWDEISDVYQQCRGMGLIKHFNDLLVYPMAFEEALEMSPFQLCMQPGGSIFCNGWQELVLSFTSPHNSISAL